MGGLFPLSESLSSLRCFPHPPGVGILLPHLPGNLDLQISKNLGSLCFLRRSGWVLMCPWRHGLQRPHPRTAEKQQPQRGGDDSQHRQKQDGPQPAHKQQQGQHPQDHQGFIGHVPLPVLSLSWRYLLGAKRNAQEIRFSSCAHFSPVIHLSVLVVEKAVGASKSLVARKTGLLGLGRFFRRFCLGGFRLFLPAAAAVLNLV